MGKKRNRTVIFFTFIILGIIITIQFRTMLADKKDNSYQALNLNALNEQLKEQEELSFTLEKLINEEIEKNDKIIQSFVEQQSNSTLREQYFLIKDIMFKSALNDVHGSGLVIKLDDALERKNYDPGTLIIHDIDIKIIINDLKKAGAQAISINDERLIDTSEQICAGPTVRINGRKYTVPYIIRAIGDPDKLNHSIRNSERIALMIKDNIRVDIKVANNIVIPAFNIGRKGISSYISYMEVLGRGEK